MSLWPRRDEIRVLTFVRRVDLDGWAVLIAVLLGLGAGFGAVTSPRIAVVAVLGGVVSTWAFVALRSLHFSIHRAWHLQWWQGLWALLFASGLVWRVRASASAAQNPLDTSGALRVGLVSLAACVLVAVVATRRIPLTPILTSPVFLLLLAFDIGNLLSTIWSVYPLWTLYRAIEFSIDTLAVAAVAASHRSAASYRQVLTWAWLLSGFVLVSVALGAIFAPSRAFLHNLGTLGISVQGVFPVVDRNGVGHTASILAVVAVARISTRSTHRRALWVGVLVLCLLTAVLSQTRSALAAIVLGGLLVLLAARRIGLIGAVPIFVLGLALFSNVGHVITRYLVRDATSQQLSTLSGRTDYWHYAWHLLQAHLLTGYGAYAGGRFLVAQAFDPTLASTHGTFPEILIGTSFWGAVPIAALLVLLWWRLLAASFLGQHAAGELSAWQTNVEALGVLGVLTVTSFFTVALISHPSIPFLAIVGYAVVLGTRDRSSKQHSQEWGR
jgi:O-antigen ligase